MWQPHEESFKRQTFLGDEEEVELQTDSNKHEDTNAVQSRWNYLLLLICFLLLSYFLYLLLQHQMYQRARFEVLRSQAMPLTGALPDPKTNFFAAMEHYERLIRG
jgi:hypothetical protein